MDSIQDILISVVMELVRVMLIIEYFQIFFEKVHLQSHILLLQAVILDFIIVY